MRSSTSNSNRRLVSDHWWFILVTTCLLVVCAYAGLEVYARSLGVEPAVTDSKELWTLQRKKANNHGDQALALLGASRIQLGLDLNVLEQHSHLKPVQLAVDGASPLSVLKHLADDQYFKGHVWLSMTFDQVLPSSEQKRINEWLKSYNQLTAHPLANFGSNIDIALKNAVRANLATRSDNLSPLQVINYAKQGKKNSYIMTTPRRERKADYSLFGESLKPYLMRVQSSLPNPPPITRDLSNLAVLERFTKHAATIKPLNIEHYDQHLLSFMSYVETIESRGGKVFILQMPIDKLIKDIDDRLGSDVYWQKIKDAHPRVIRYKDFPSLQAFELPDGSHLDVKDKAQFTYNLIEVLKTYYDFE